MSLVARHPMCVKVMNTIDEQTPTKLFYILL